MNELFSLKIKLSVLETLHHRGFGHYGGSLSIVPATAVLYEHFILQKVGELDYKKDDFFILSKGHGGPCQYAALAHLGWFDFNLLKTLNENGTKLPSHPDRLLTPGIQMTTGSLGQGISNAVGIALGCKLNKTNQKVYVVLGDGELNEGQCWEAFMFANHHQLKNLIIYIDENKKQLDGETKDICDNLDLILKFQSFGFHTVRVKGNNLEAIKKATEEALTNNLTNVIILDTIKGQGVDFLEKMIDNHHLRPNEETENKIQNYIEMLKKEIENYGNA